MPKKPAVAVRVVQDVDVPPYEWMRGWGKRDLGHGTSRVSVIRVGTVRASSGWTRGEGKDGPESESKSDSAHLDWSSRKVHGLPTNLVADGQDGRQGW